MASDKSNLAWIDGWRTRFSDGARPQLSPDKQRGWDAANDLLTRVADLESRDQSLQDQITNLPSTGGGYGVR